MSKASEQHPTELLPWLVNGTLQGAEREAVQAHVAGCTRCQAEADLLRAMRRAVQAGPTVGAGELGWQRLRRSLRREHTVTPRWVWPAALAASLVIVAQTALLVQGLPERARYEPLGERAVVEQAAQVRFVPEASEAALRALLREAGVRIIDGPSAAGVYRLALDPERDPDEVTELLQARPDLIRHFALE